jgi:hypothetical protein
MESTWLTFRDVRCDVGSREEHERHGKLGALCNILALLAVELKSGAGKHLENLLVQTALLGHGELDAAATEARGERGRVLGALREEEGRGDRHTRLM